MQTKTDTQIEFATLSDDELSEVSGGLQRRHTAPPALPTGALIPKGKLSRSNAKRGKPKTEQGLAGLPGHHGTSSAFHDAQHHGSLPTHVYRPPEYKP